MSELPPASALPERAAPVAYALAALAVTVTSALAAILRWSFGLPDLEMLFLLTVMVCAVGLGRGPAIFAAALGVASYDYFFVLPLHTFSVDDRRYMLTFGMMFGVGYAMSELTGRLQRQERDAVAREERTALLHALSRELAASDDGDEIAQIGARIATRTLGGAAFVLREGREGVAATPANAALLATLPTTLPLQIGRSAVGTLALAQPLGEDQRVFAELLARQLAAALERARLADEARAAVLRARTEELRASLLSTVSHDLRTPLASITGAATALRDAPEPAALPRAELLDAIVSEAARLERLVANLLDMTRLESGALTLRRDWVPLEEVVGSALGRLEGVLGERPVSVQLAPELPLLLIDPVLLEQVFVNLLENADKYTPAGSALVLRATRDGAWARIDVEDEGPGLPAGDPARLFEKFTRGAGAGPRGVGLGLAICKGIVEAHGGRIRAENRPQGGARFRVELPCAEPPPLPEDPP